MSNEEKSQTDQRVVRMKVNRIIPPVHNLINNFFMLLLHALQNVLVKLPGPVTYWEFVINPHSFTGQISFGAASSCSPSP